ATPSRSCRASSPSPASSAASTWRRATSTTTASTTSSWRPAPARRADTSRSLTAPRWAWGSRRSGRASSRSLAASASSTWRSAASDNNNDGFADSIIGAGPGAPGGHVKVFAGKTADFNPLQSFFAFPGFLGGINVAAGDVNGDGFTDILVGAGPGAPGGHVKV